MFDHSFLHPFGSLSMREGKSDHVSRQGFVPYGWTVLICLSCCLRVGKFLCESNDDCDNSSIFHFACLME